MNDVCLLVKKEDPSLLRNDKTSTLFKENSVFVFPKVYSQGCKCLLESTITPFRITTIFDTESKQEYNTTQERK